MSDSALGACHGFSHWSRQVTEGISELNPCGVGRRTRVIAGGLQLVHQAYPLIEQALPQAKFVSEAPGIEAGSMNGGDLDVVWQPSGLRDTLLPPGETGKRVYAVVVVLSSYLSGSDPLAYISLMTQAEAADWNKGGGGFDPNAIIQAPNIPTRIYSLPRSTGAALLALLYAPDATPSS